MNWVAVDMDMVHGLKDSEGKRVEERNLPSDQAPGDTSAWK